MKATAPAISGESSAGTITDCTRLCQFTALLLDSLAIAAQSLVGAALGGADPTLARSFAWRVAGYGFWAGMGFAAIIAAGWFAIPASTWATRGRGRWVFSQRRSESPDGSDA